ncbi:MAG: phosphoribosyltransferase family protein [Candidatus Paceibacterota bacterium]
MILKDRKEAGEKLALKLKEFKDTESIVYALPRGGVVVAHEIAKNLNLPLSLVITRKIGSQFNSEYAICSVAEDGHSVCNEQEEKDADQEWLKEEFEKEKKEAKRRREVYLENDQVLSPKNKTAIIVDDGIATGLTIKLAIKEIKHEGPARIIVAVPVAPFDTISKIQGEVDRVVALEIDRDYLGAVGEYYEYFPQIEDEEVIRIMSEYK